jgi:heat shock protein HtpX
MGGHPFLDAEAQREHARRNLLHTVALISGLGGLLAVSALLIWGWLGVAGAAIMTLLAAVGGQRVPPELVMRLYRARPVDPLQGGSLNTVMDELARRAELPVRPLLYVIPSLTLNAFATGTPRHAAIAITEGLLRKLDLREIVAVLAHEISHIRNNDLAVMGLADVMTRLMQSLSYVALVLAAMNVLAGLVGDQAVSWWAVLLLYLAPALASLIQLGLSRAREYDADLEAAMLTGDPDGLISALRRLEHYTGSIWEDLMYPVPARRVPVPSILRTHPSTSDRVARLIELADRRPEPTLVVAEGPMTTLVGLGPIALAPRYRWPGVWF